MCIISNDYIDSLPVLPLKMLFKMITGKWVMRFGHMQVNFKFLPGGKLLFGKTKVKLVASKVKRFPAIRRWFTFRVRQFVYYIRLTTKGSIIFKFNVKKTKGCKRRLKGVKKLFFCGKGKGGKSGQKGIKF